MLFKNQARDRLFIFILGPPWEVGRLEPSGFLKKNPGQRCIPTPVHPIKRVRCMLKNIIALRRADWGSCQDIKQTILKEDGVERDEKKEEGRGLI
jgi:hypothetical protein